jgi:hypothetical protein
MNNIKTHFLYIHTNTEAYQVALGFLPYVPRVGEYMTLIALNRETGLWDITMSFRVGKVAYELYGEILPVSRTWENDSQGGGCQVILHVTPDDQHARDFVNTIIEIESAKE